MNETVVWKQKKTKTKSSLPKFQKFNEKVLRPEIWVDQRRVRSDEVKQRTLKKIVSNLITQNKKVERSRVNNWILVEKKTQNSTFKKRKKLDESNYVSSVDVLSNY